MLLTDKSLWQINIWFSYLGIASVFYEQDEAVKESKQKPLNEEIIPFYLGKLEEIAKENDGHLALKRITWADFYFTGMIEYLNTMSNQDLTAKYPNLKKVTENVLALEGVKKWIARRP